VEEEYRLKQTNARAFRRLCARIPEPWVNETVPFERQPKLNPNGERWSHPSCI
jgi:hypothetical protein